MKKTSKADCYVLLRVFQKCTHIMLTLEANSQGFVHIISILCVSFIVYRLCVSFIVYRLKLLVLVLFSF